MRVLYVLRYYPTLSETFVYREIIALQRLGVHVEVAALGTRSDGALADDLPDVVVHRPPRGAASMALVAPMLAALGSPSGREALSLGQHLRAKDRARAVWLAALARGFDRLHVHFAGEAAVWAHIACESAAVPFSVTTHAADLFVPRPELPQVLQAADVVLTISDWHRDWLERFHQVQATVVPCGVEPRRYGRAEPGGEGPLRIVTVARWVPKKGLDTLVAAVARLGADWRLRLVSEPAIPLEDPRIRSGACRPSGIPALLSGAQVFVLPCRTAPSGDQDGLPVALLEAMMAGLPVVTTRVSGIPEVVDEDVGWWVEPDDVDGLVQVLEEVAASPEERARRGAAARERVLEQGRTVQAQAQRLLAAWRQA